MSRPQLMDQYGRPLRSSASLLVSGGAYQAASRNRQQTVGWSASAVSSASETYANRQPIAARARDLIRNSGIATGAMRKVRAQTIGPGLRLRAKPDATRLGVDPTEALTFSRKIEGAWSDWADDHRHQCDLARTRTFGQLSRIMWSDRFTTGENLAVLRWKEDRGTDYATCVQLVDPERLSNPGGKMDEDLLRQGIGLSPDGEPIEYHIRDRHPSDYVSSSHQWQWTRMPRYAEDGRRVVVHGFPEDRSEQLRGVSPLAPILTAFRDLSRFTEAEIGAAIINATMAAFVKSGFDPLAVIEAIGADEGGSGLADIGKGWHETRMGIYGEEGLSLHDNRIATLAPGDEVQMNNTTRQVGSFSDFKKAFLQDFAAAIGIPYMVLSEDWEGVSYSAARAALAETWRIVTEDRADFVADSILPIYAEIVTEAFWRGYLVEPDGWPSFEGNEAAYLKADWTGPGRGYVDPLKEAQANLLNMRIGATTLDKVCADQGLDWESTLVQLATEKQRMEELGIAPAELAEALAAIPPTDKEG
ncbi:phage portal protein [Hyphomonas pacifica]|uniref:Phage portal protein n=1 Tax=Hyphomonas pacifica TaxID=1280941 RepID=A0A8B2PKS7_9PROT|nr:phage portal protein [Hyphomonas pacifica]RAN30642.1 hypothetical protein HY3_05690 [Hyphomonas pacifica]